MKALFRGRGKVLVSKAREVKIDMDLTDSESGETRPESSAPQFLGEGTCPELTAGIGELTRRLLELGRLVETAIARSITALFRRDHHLAETVIKEDAAIDAFEVQIEQQCVDLLEKYHPVGSELRFLIAVLKINDTLERMGDLAENIADTVVAVSKSEDFVRIGDFQEMADRTKKMLTNCLRCFVDGDVKLAYQVIDDDAGVDALQDNILKRIQRELDGPGMAARILLHMEYVARQLERISDLTTNVAEDVIYMIDGKIVRHPSRFKNPTGTFAVGSAVYRRMS